MRVRDVIDRMLGRSAQSADHAEGDHARSQERAAVLDRLGRQELRVKFLETQIDVQRVGRKRR